MITHRSGCHCRRARFEVIAPAALQVSECNCSICAESGFLGLVVPKARFRLLSGAECLATCSFNTGVARHLFCSHCGIKSFYVPRSRERARQPQLPSEPTPGMMRAPSEMETAGW